MIGSVEISSCHGVDETLRAHGFAGFPSSAGYYRCVGYMPKPDGRRYTVFARGGPLAALAKFTRLAAEKAAGVTDDKETR